MDKTQQLDKFSFFRSFWEAVKLLPRRDRLPLLEAIIAYGLDGQVPDSLTPAQSAYFLLVAPVLSKSRAKAAAGRQGGSKGQGKEKQAESIPASAAKQTQSHMEEEKEMDKEKKLEGETGVPAPIAEGFDIFWQAYPSKIGRQAAYRAWCALSPEDGLAQEICMGLEQWKASRRWQENGGRFIPRAAKFLAERHWEAPPQKAREALPKGASGQLGQAELDAIRQVMEGDL